MLAVLGYPLAHHLTISRTHKPALALMRCNTQSASSDPSARLGRSFLFLYHSDWCIVYPFLSLAKLYKLRSQQGLTARYLIVRTFGYTTRQVGAEHGWVTPTVLSVLGSTTHPLFTSKERQDVHEGGLCPAGNILWV